MDTTTKILIGAAGVAVASYAGTQLMIRFPGARAWLEKVLIEAYAYLDKHKLGG